MSHSRHVWTKCFGSICTLGSTRRTYVAVCLLSLCSRVRSLPRAHFVYKLCCWTHGSSLWSDEHRRKSGRHRCCAPMPYLALHFGWVVALNWQRHGTFGSAVMGIHKSRQTFYASRSLAILPASMPSTGEFQFVWSTKEYDYGHWCHCHYPCTSRKKRGIRSGFHGASCSGTSQRTRLQFLLLNRSKSDLRPIKYSSLTWIKLH